MRHLVLDLGGVLLEDPVDEVFDLLAQSGKESAPSIREYYYEDLHDDLWTGEMKEEDFWQRLCSFASVEGMEEEARATLLESLTIRYKSKPALWANHTDLYVLSNHLTAWAMPRIEEMGQDNFKEIWISDSLGAAKPHPAAFAPLLDLEGEVLFVDDKIQNTEAASALGIPSLLADEENLWVYEIESRLGMLDPL